MSDSQDPWNPRPLPDAALAADYMAGLAKATLTAHAQRTTDQDDRTRSFWPLIEQRALTAADKMIWRAADDETRVPIVADLFYQFPDELAAPAAEVLGFPGFLSRALRRLVELDSERSRPTAATSIKKLFYSQLVASDEIGKLLKSEEKLAAIVARLHEPEKSSGRLAKIRRGIVRAAGFIFHFHTETAAPTDQTRNDIVLEALRLLVRRPGLVRKIAETVQMAVPFSIVLACELDEINRSRAERS